MRSNLDTKGFELRISRPNFVMTHNEIAPPESPNERSFLGPSLLAIGLIVAGVTLWMVNDEAEKRALHAPVTVVSKNG
jgi:hypothetical protein